MGLLRADSLRLPSAYACRSGDACCYCTAAGRREMAEAELAKHGPVVKSPSGYPIQNPWLAIANKALEQMMKIGIELGLTPASRSRIKAARLAKPTASGGTIFQDYRVAHHAQ